MLIDKGLTSGEVVSLKLSSGEEIVAKLVEDHADSYELAKPLTLSVSQQGVGMIPFMFTVNPEKTIKINKSCVVAAQVTDRQFANQYTQGTTGIALG